MKKCLLIGGESHGRIISVSDDYRREMQVPKPYSTPVRFYDMDKPGRLESFMNNVELYQLTVTSPTNCIYSIYGMSQDYTVNQIVQLVETLQAKK